MKKFAIAVLAAYALAVPAFADSKPSDEEAKKITEQLRDELVENKCGRLYGRRDGKRNRRLGRV